MGSYLYNKCWRDAGEKSTSKSLLNKATFYGVEVARSDGDLARGKLYSEETNSRTKKEQAFFFFF